LDRALLGFEIRVSCMEGRHSITWTMLQPFFASVVFQIGSLVSYYAFPVKKLRSWCVPPHQTRDGERASLLTFCPGWLYTSSLLISASQVAGITTTMCHHAQSLMYRFFKN
jgi:hypothetical protein